MAMYIDTHTHINFSAFKNDYKQIIDRALSNSVWMINVGSQNTTSERAVKIADEYSEGVYAAVGLHPIHLFNIDVDENEVKFHSRREEFDKDYYKRLVESSKKVVAIGETGFDLYHLPNDVSLEDCIKKQREVFEKHIELSIELRKPLMIHVRGDEKKPSRAYQEIIDTLKQFPKAKGVIHCFNSTKDIAYKFLKLGFYISFTGIITFKNAVKVQEVVKCVPLDRILSETDAPYLTPVPYRGKRNEPLYVKYVIKKIAELKGQDEIIVKEQILKNAKELFGI